MDTYLTLTSARVTLPSRRALETALRAIAPDVGYTVDGAKYRLKKDGAWTPAQTALAQTAIDTTPELTAQASYTLSSRDKDRLTSIAVNIRGRDVAAWTAKTTPQKMAAVLAEADTWATIRDFIETNA